MKIVIGAGDKEYKGYIRVDFREEVSPDVLHDLNTYPWPFEACSCEEITAEDVIEHLESVIDAVEEAHRILSPGGLLYIVTPHWQHPNSWTDPTHRWHLAEGSFDYFDPSTPYGRKYDYYSRCKFCIIGKNIAGGNIHVRMVKR